MKWHFIYIPLAVLATALIGSYLTSSGMAWYKTLNLPAITPPGAIIGLVWTIIFILTAISAIIAWDKIHDGKVYYAIIIIFILNLVLNVLWSLLFFNQQLILASIVEMIILEISVIALIVLLHPFSRLAAYLLLPYALWVAFATYLAYSVWSLNK